MIPPPTPEERARVARRAGLCTLCVHLQVLRSKRSVFVRCALSDHNPAFDRYPPLPVVRCRGHQPIKPPTTPEP